MLDHYSVHVHNNQQVAALPQLDRGSDYESERHRFESYTPHHLNLKPPATGAFLLWRHSTPEARLESCAAVRGRLFLIDSCKIPSRCRGPSATTPSFND